MALLRTSAAASAHRQVYPDDLTVESLTDLLRQGDIDVSAFGVGQARSLAELLQEVKERSVALTVAQEDGSVQRTLGVVAVIVERTGADGETMLLLGTHEELPDGRQRTQNKLPNRKLPPPFDDNLTMACTLLKKELGIEPAAVKVRMESTTTFLSKTYQGNFEIVSMRQSSSYPGIQSKYTARYIVAEVDGIDTSSTFSTTEGPGSQHAGHIHHWCWMKKKDWEVGVNKSGVYHNPGRNRRTTAEIKTMCMELENFRLLTPPQRRDQLECVLASIMDSDVNVQCFVDQKIHHILADRLATVGGTMGKDEAAEADLVLSAISGLLLSLMPTAKKVVQQDQTLSNHLRRLAREPGLAANFPKISCSATTLLALLNGIDEGRKDEVQRTRRASLSISQSDTAVRATAAAGSIASMSTSSADQASRPQRPPLPGLDTSRQHVMVSYAWSMREEVYQIAEELQQDFDLWIDGKSYHPFLVFTLVLSPIPRIHVSCITHSSYSRKSYHPFFVFSQQHEWLDTRCHG
jgi:hypothetical protein